MQALYKVATRNTMPLQRRMCSTFGNKTGSQFSGITRRDDNSQYWLVGMGTLAILGGVYWYYKREPVEKVSFRAGRLDQ